MPLNEPPCITVPLYDHHLCPNSNFIWERFFEILQTSLILRFLSIDHQYDDNRSVQGSGTCIADTLW